MDANPGNLILLQVHWHDDYAIPWGYDRADFYSVVLTPTVWFDGIEERLGYPVSPPYDRTLADRLQVPTDVTLQMGADEITPGTFRVVTRVHVDKAGQPRALRVYTVLALDQYPTGDYHRNCLMDAAPTVDLSLQPDECAVVTQVFTLDSRDDRSEYKLIAWAQEPVASAPAKVFQAANIDWPFPSLGGPGDADRDGDVDLVDLAAFTLCQLGPDDEALPTDCAEPFDFDHDNDVDLLDFAAFQRAFTGACP